MSIVGFISFLPTIFSPPAFLQTHHFHDLKDHIEDSTELPPKARNTFLNCDKDFEKAQEDGSKSSFTLLS